MLKKRILSLFVAMTLVLTASLPSVTFATDNETQLEEVVEESTLEKTEEELVHCVQCDSENVSLLVSLFNLYHCEDCGKYFTVGSDTNKKTISEQVSALEEDAKTEANETLFGLNDNITVVYIIFQDGVSRDNFSYVYDKDAIAKYPEIDNEEVFGSHTTIFPGWTFKGYATAANGAVMYRPGDRIDSRRVFTVYEKNKYDINVYRNYSSDDEELIDSKEVIYGESYTYTEGTPERGI